MTIIPDRLPRPLKDTPKPSVDELEAVFHAALKAGDVQGIEAAIRVMVTVDPHRAGELWDALDLAVTLARKARP